MTVLWANQALTTKGWENSVLIEIGKDGRITKVQADSPATGNRVGTLLPAISNLHSHAFQRSMAGLTEKRGPDPRDTFWTWRQLMFRFLDQLTPDHVQDIAAFVQMEMLEAGYANNTEFHYLHHQPGGVPYDNIAEMAERIAAAANITGIGLTLLPVHYQFGGCDKRPLGAGQIRFGNDPERFAKLYEESERALKSLPSDTRMGVAPHSLRAVGREDLIATTRLSKDGPVHMHLAEQVAEVEEVAASWGKRPVEWLLEHADVDENWCLIHCTQMQEHETLGLARTGAVAGLCPITESSLGDGIFDGVRYLNAGGNIGVGSDSNIRISLSEELRTLEYSQRLRDKSRAALATPEKSTARRLFDAVAKGGAQAAGRNAGRIEVGALADLMALDGAAVDLIGRTGDTILDTYVFAGDDRMVRDVWSAGRHVVTEGRHIAHDTITGRYRKVMEQLKEAV
ncbi:MULTISPECIES: formimidoylglutamate deiminase [Thalassospira]|jgi:formimidoylglutamate deiminase|uniref:Formimidoylglutamate deiminase n=1 Tax=Thalassospira xiamenensis TaxID=220697 RepID=A0ABR5Y6W0_9PROT|nr:MULTISPECIES: formimidoylglutamate deiminase [Thalassospira]KZD06581.1 formimidoylglutamate deiminase [Thalassospira xiamenensis]KZD10821.1 formimidoylglutamate deiminase [Thalassospira xiamenensis]MAB32365.1 formimidoylglutamate deiminase [Thalassospira sp.]MBL4842658.1 formimidoylglutamate deiminase [Thalassospira sp.]MCD1592725.1 formimidoylglutamate deiminase [Thalassospira xiamenensis]|tara:strand:- start:1173 stop:2537 length:1365 start_codon:yes stop_codon:yes gene_type:complete